MFSIQSNRSPGIVNCCRATLCILLAFTSSVGATIVGSVHDLSGSGLTNGEVCIVCHTPHDATESVGTPLWNHEVSTATYTLYSSDTLQYTPEQPGPGNVSRLCLSCHDGTIAIDSFGGNGGTQGNTLTGEFVKGTDLSDDHPVGVYWDHQTIGYGTDCLTCHAMVWNPDRGVFELPKRPGGDLRFFNRRVECPSCHDVHNNQVKDVKLLRKTMAGSQLCLHCHLK